MSDSGKRYLARMLACAEAHEFLGERTFAEAWAACDRADWMLMVMERDLGKDDPEVLERCRWVKTECVETARIHGAKEDVIEASLRPGEHLTPLMRRHPELRRECAAVFRAAFPDELVLARLREKWGVE